VSVYNSDGSDFKGRKAQLVEECYERFGGSKEEDIANGFTDDPKVLGPSGLWALLKLAGEAEGEYDVKPRDAHNTSVQELQVRVAEVYDLPGPESAFRRRRHIPTHERSVWAKRHS